MKIVGTCKYEKQLIPETLNFNIITSDKNKKRSNVLVHVQLMPKTPNFNIEFGIRKQEHVTNDRNEKQPNVLVHLKTTKLKDMF